ncbi:MAG: transporter substrate-binding domain-containing protein, partial [Pseudomonadota bacterium]
MRVRLLNAGVMLAAGVALGGAAWGGPALGDTIAALKQGGALKLGYRVDAPPFSRALSDAELQERKARSGAEVAPAIGFSIDLCQRAAAAVRAATRPDLPVEYVPVTVEDRFESLESGRIDLLCGATTFTLQRQRRFELRRLRAQRGERRR